MNFDPDALNRKLNVANSAKLEAAFMADMVRCDQIIAEEGSRTAKRNATLVAGAEASIAQKELLEEQLETIREQNKLLLDNYEKLKELYDDQVQANKDAKDDLEKSRRFNRWMMVISVIAMLAAVASPIVTLWVS